MFRRSILDKLWQYHVDFTHSPVLLRSFYCIPFKNTVSQKVVHQTHGDNFVNY